MFKLQFSINSNVPLQHLRLAVHLISIKATHSQSSSWQKPTRMAVKIAKNDIFLISIMCRTFNSSMLENSSESRVAIIIMIIIIIISASALLGGLHFISL